MRTIVKSYQERQCTLISVGGRILKSSKYFAGLKTMDAWKLCHGLNGRSILTSVSLLWSPVLSITMVAQSPSIRKKTFANICSPVVLNLKNVNFVKKKLPALRYRHI
jgi:hypothetical protein